MTKSKNNGNKIQIKVRKLHPDAVIPSYAHDGDVCMDLTAVSVEYDTNKDMYIYHTGLAFESDKNIGQFLYLRSSNCKTDAYLCNGVGVADSAIYRGEIQLRMKNRVPTLSVLEQEKRDEEIKKFYIKAISEPRPKTNWFKKLFGIKEEVVTSENILSAITPHHFTKDEITNKMKQLQPYGVGDRVGQMVFMKYPTVELIEVDELSDTERGEGGFGSTGK